MLMRIPYRMVGLCLLMLAGLLASKAMAQDDFLTSYNSSKWTGGSVDNDADGVADFCIMIPKNPRDQVMLILDTNEGLMIGLINSHWRMEELGNTVDVQLVIQGHWQGHLDARISDTDTLAITVGYDTELIEAIKAGSVLNAYLYIGDFTVSLSGTRDAVDTAKRCYSEQIQPHQIQTAPVTSSAPSHSGGSATYSDGKLAYESANYGDALEIWQQAAMQGDAKAMNGLGLMHQGGKGVPKDADAALYWFTMAADLGLDEAQYNLARHHDNGWGTAVNFDLAAHWYEKSALQGYDRAQLSLGIAYMKGQGVAKNPQTARHWYSLAAQNGNRAAQFNLGTLLRKGLGGDKNPAEAVYWYRRSADQGFGWAQLRLGDALAQGLAGPIDRIEAYKWYLLAVENGKDQATEKLAELDAIVSPADQQRARDLMDGWQEVPEPRTQTTQVQPVQLDVVIAQTVPEKAPVTKKLPDDLFGDLQPAPKATPVPAAKPQATGRVEGCYDLAQARTTCKATCNSPAFSETFAASQFVRKNGAQAAVQYCLNGCQQAENEFTQALNTVAVLKGSKFFCPMLYAETTQLAKDNKIPGEHGDKSARKSHATGSTTFNEASRLDATPEHLATLSRAAYTPAVQALVDQMPAVLEGCYDTQSPAAMAHCRAECIDDARFPGTGLTSEQALDLCNSGCDKAAVLFKDQAIWLQAKSEDGLSGTFCGAVQFTKIIRDEVRNEALMDGHTKYAASEIVGGIGGYWRGALIAGGR